MMARLDGILEGAYRYAAQMPVDKLETMLPDRPRSYRQLIYHIFQIPETFVDVLDLCELGFERATAAATGRPGYHPSVLLKLYIYGYLNRVQSSRRLEREAGRNVETMWLLGRLETQEEAVAEKDGTRVAIASSDYVAIIFWPRLT